MPRIPTSDPNANLAVTLFDSIMAANGWGLDEAWLAITKLLTSCQVWQGGTWITLGIMPPGTPVLMERNNYRRTKSGGPNRHMRDAIAVRDHLAALLGVTPSNLASQLGLFFRQPQVSQLQPNNPRGHAFRSLVAHTLATYGDQNLTVVEEERAHQLFPGHQLATRSRDSKIDIVVFRGNLLVSLVSVRWTYRHDRVDMLDEAYAYVPPARRTNSACRFWGVTNEFGTARLTKVIRDSKAAQPNGILDALVHLNPHLPSTVVKRNHELANLKSLAGFVNDSFSWR